MLAEWTKGFTANAYCRQPWDIWLHVTGGEGPADDPVGALLERGLDPFAFPVHLSSVTHETLIRARQRECGVDMDRADNPDYLEELTDAIHAACAALPDLTN